MKPVTCRFPFALCFAVLAAIVGASMPLSAQRMTGGQFVLVGAPGGGGISQGGSYRISGYVTSGGAETSAGADFELAGGLLVLHFGTAGDVVLHVQWTAEGTVRIWWPAHITGYELEATTTLGPDASWIPLTPIPAGNEFVTSPLEPTRFFRLRATEP